MANYDVFAVSNEAGPARAGPEGVVQIILNDVDYSGWDRVQR